MKRQTPIQTQKKETMPPQMRGFLPHAAVRMTAEHDMPSNVLAETRFGHDFSRVAVHPSTPVISQDYSNASCPISPQRCPFGGACHTCPPGIRPSFGLQDKPNLIPMALHGGEDLGSPCIECEDEEGLKTSPLPGGGIVDPLEEEEKQALESWIVSGKETSMTNNKTRGDDDLLRSWVVGGAATPGINTIKCDGKGGIVVQAEGTGNAVQTACLKDCIIRHEESHKTDALAANAKICKGATSGNIVTVNTAAERKATEVKASNVEVNCLKAKPETKACKTIIANRITQMIAYRDSF